MESVARANSRSCKIVLRIDETQKTWSELKSIYLDSCSKEVWNEISSNLINSIKNLKKDQWNPSYLIYQAFGWYQLNMVNITNIALDWQFSDKIIAQKAS